MCELRRFQNARCNDKNSSYLSVRPSIRMEQLASHFTDIRDIWYLSIFWKSVEKMQASLISDKNNGYFTWRPIYIFIISRSVVLRMRNASNKSCGENQNTHLIFSNSPTPESHAVYMIWKNTVDPYRPRMTIWRMRITCWILKAANTHS